MKIFNLKIDSGWKQCKRDTKMERVSCVVLNVSRYLKQISYFSGQKSNPGPLFNKIY